MFRRLFSVFLLGIACVATPVFAQNTPPATPSTGNPTASAPAAAQTTAPATPAAARSIPLSMPINGQTSVTGLPEYITLVFRYMLGVASILATIMIVYGGFLYLLGATTGSTMSGKARIQDAITGLVLLFLAYALLFTISPSLVRLQVRGLTNIRELGVQVQNGPPTAQQVQQRGTDSFSIVGDSCSDQACQSMATRMNRAGEYICDPLARPRPGVSCTGTDCQMVCVLRAGTPAGVNGAGGSAPTAVGTAPVVLATCAMDSDCGGVTCMRTGLVRNGDTGPLLVGQDRARKLGMCSDGREGARCKCVGDGCRLSRANYDPRLFDGRTIEDAIRTFPTNNLYAGETACQRGFTCQQEGQDWYCRRDPNVRVGT